MKSKVRDKVAVVTGAGSGIGRQLALELAKRGARLAISDIDDLSVAQTADRVKALRADVHASHLDVRDRAAVEAYAATVVEHYGVVHQIYNNAGVSGGGRTVLDAEWDSYERTIGINLFGVIHGTKAFLPHLIASGAGHVVNVSSVNGLMSQPTLSAYAASKFAVRGFTETLRTEMLDAGHPVQVSVVHPSGVKTNIASATLDEARENGLQPSPEQVARTRVYNEKMLRMPAEQVARIIVDGVETGSPRILIGASATIVDLVVRLLPRTYPKLAVLIERRMFGSPSSR
jgi:NAD(P)-dependent dehydrogenase (short-subunit alcohol dehydrogenase family)